MMCFGAKLLIKRGRIAGANLVNGVLANWGYRARYWTDRKRN